MHGVGRSATRAGHGTLDAGTWFTAAGSVQPSTRCTHEDERKVVAITPGGLYLLEANLSCNFFRASLDRQQYYSFVGEAIGWLERKTP